MSTNLAYATPIRRPREEEYLEPTPSRVRIVATRAQRRERPKLVYAIGATVVIFGIFLTQLMITIALSSGAYTIDGLQAKQQNLGRTASSLGERLDTLGSSQNLQANALALGMVASSNAAFLRLSDGAVLGSAAPAAPDKASAAAAKSVPNSLLVDIPVISSTGSVAPTTTLTSSTGTGHGDTNAGNSSVSNTESTQGQPTQAQVGTTTAAAPATSSGDLPSPVTH